MRPSSRDGAVLFFSYSAGPFETSRVSSGAILPVFYVDFGQKRPYLTDADEAFVTF